jgi:type IV secretory pathway VirB10-like protein
MEESNMKTNLLSVNIIIALIFLLTGCNEVKKTATNYQSSSQVTITSTSTSTTSTSPTQRFKRVALVIGNADYQFAPLDNPVNDAEDITAVLKKLGFEVISIKNATHQSMDTAINRFKRQLGKQVIGLFYFSGHGVQYEGINYMIPADMPKLTVSNVKFKSVPIEYVLSTMEETNNQVNLIILDACRNSPFRGGKKGVSKGLAPVTAPSGSLIAYATSPGKVAADGPNRNSPYTKHLKTFLLKPSLTIEDMFKEVGSAVKKDTYGEQTPWLASSFYGKIYLAGEKTPEQMERERRERERLAAEKRQKEQERLAEQKRRREEQQRLAEEKRRLQRAEEKRRLQRAEEKRRLQQAEEKRRLQQAEEKRRLQQAEEKRRLQREKERLRQQREEENCKGCNCKEIRQQESLGFPPLTPQQKAFKKTCQYNN